MAAVRAKDVSGPVHVLRENGTVLDASSFDKSFELGDRVVPRAMEGNACYFSVFLFTFGIQLKVVGHPLDSSGNWNSGSSSGVGLGCTKKW